MHAPAQFPGFPETACWRWRALAADYPYRVNMVLVDAMLEQ